MNNQSLSLSEAYREKIRYRRSPRVIKKVNSEAVEFSNPPQKAKMPRGSIIQLIIPPLCMVAVTIGISILMRRGAYVLMSAAGTLMTVIKIGRAHV